MLMFAVRLWQANIKKFFSQLVLAVFLYELSEIKQRQNVDVRDIKKPGTTV